MNGPAPRNLLQFSAPARHCSPVANAKAVILRVCREPMKKGHTIRGTVALTPIHLAETMLCWTASPAMSDHRFWDIGIHRLHVGRDIPVPAP